MIIIIIRDNVTHARPLSLMGLSRKMVTCSGIEYYINTFIGRLALQGIKARGLEIVVAKFLLEAITIFALTRPFSLKRPSRKMTLFEYLH
jgi:hypothetical protein